ALARSIRAQDTPTICFGDVNQSAREMSRSGHPFARNACGNRGRGGFGFFGRGFEAGPAVEPGTDLATGPLELSAIVKNCLGHRYGFQFLELLPEQCQKIQASCKGVPPYRSSLPAE